MPHPFRELFGMILPVAPARHRRHPGSRGEYRERYLGVRIPRTNLQPEHLGAARGFAKDLADTLTHASAG